MIYQPEKYIRKDLVDYNEEYSKLQGILEDKIAKVTLIKFLRQNIGFTFYLLTGIRLEPYQIITIKAMLNRNFSMCVWGRGASKTTVAAFYSILQCIFEPNTNILVAGPTFRTARFIFEKIEEFANSKDGVLLRACFTKINKNPDIRELKINGGSIRAIPLNGEKIRGFRANVLVLDEFLLLSEDIVKRVLMPFLVAPHNVAERIRVRRIEDRLIKMGKMKEEERRVFRSNIKMIVLSSASYTFENLYITYQDWINKIYAESGKEFKDNETVEEALKDVSYFVSQLSYEALPEHMIDINVINEAKNTSSDAIFDREYRAKFTDGSASYFSAKKMHECTLKLNEYPHILVRGEENKKYILAIDPSFSQSPASDFFSMSIFELDESNQTGTLVHNYARAGKDLKEHVNYFYYIMKNFNIVMGIVDNADGNFIQAVNESKLFQDNKIKYDFFDFESETDNAKYAEILIEARKQYNIEGGRIFFKQIFNADFYIKRANEYLQTNIDRKRIFFASPINGNDNAFDKVVNSGLDLEYIGENNYIDFIDNLDANIVGTKKEATLIELTVSATGNQSFDLPLNLRKSTSPNRARKDRYTTLVLGNWAIKCYFDILGARKKERTVFMPIMI